MSRPAPLPAPLYQGSVNTWECDEGGHLNVRFHLERAMIGLAHMGHALGVSRAFTGRAGSTLVPLEGHIRFLQEARPGAPLVMHGGVIKLGEDDATVCLDMRHGDGAPASTFTLRVAHVDTRAFRPFPWSERTRAAASALQCPLPVHARPRSIDLSQPAGQVSRARALAVGAARIGATMVFPDQCDAFGRMRGEHFVGRISDSVPNLLAQWREQTAASAGGEAKVEPAGAVVEARVVFRGFPHAGDLIEVFSGVAEVGAKTLRLVHWLVDPESGAAWASMEAVALTFDVATRKTIAPSEGQRTAMRNRIVAMRV
jgi:acyl-CoA thioester hydrolase